MQPRRRGRLPGYDPTTLPEFHDIGIGPTPHPRLLRVAQLAAVDVRANGQHDLTAMARKTTTSPHSHHPWPALAPGPLFATSIACTGREPSAIRVGFKPSDAGDRLLRLAEAGEIRSLRRHP